MTWPGTCRFFESVLCCAGRNHKFRDNLFPIGLYTKEEAGDVIDMIECRQEKFYHKFGLPHPMPNYVYNGRAFLARGAMTLYPAGNLSAHCACSFINEFLAPRMSWVHSPL